MRKLRPQDRAAFEYALERMEFKADILYIVDQVVVSVSRAFALAEPLILSRCKTYPRVSARTAIVTILDKYFGMSKAQISDALGFERTNLYHADQVHAQRLEKDPTYEEFFGGALAILIAAGHIKEQLSSDEERVLELYVAKKSKEEEK